MTLRVRLLPCLLLLLGLGFFSSNLLAQKFDGESVALTSAEQKAILSAQFKAYEVWRIDVAQFDAYVKKDNGTYGKPLDLQLGSHRWKLELVPSDLLSPDYTLQVLTPAGLEVTKPAENKAFKGTELNGLGHVRLTVDEDFLSGYIKEGKKTWHIEQLWRHDRSAARDIFVVYDRDNVIRTNFPGTCGAEELEENRHILQQKKGSHEGHSHEAESSALVELEYALASDNSMVIKYGSASGVENHNIAVVNDVEGDYNGSFNHDLCIEIVTQFISAGADPWTNSTNAGTLLNSFRNWGNAGNFGVTFDDAGLWTNRDFDGTTIGIAFLNGICNSSKYHCLQDFTSNSEFLRVLNSHEMGHNFSLTHDPQGSPTIMSPSVNNSTTWSSQSVNQFNNFSQPLVNNGCLGPCGPPPPPLVAEFIWSPNPGCVGQAVQFTDQSTGQITGRAWTFPGGSPATSTQTNPTVTWSTPGVKNVKLTLTGTGGPVSLTKQVTINPLPVASFTSSVTGLTVQFTSTSSNATGWSWDFGDGLGFSNEENPLYTYLDPGNYFVKLTVENECGTSTKTILVITAPTAEFTAFPTQGCTSMTTQFQNQSSPNATSYQWQFPGGVPAQSVQQNPIVIYHTPGNYNVILTATNASGSVTITKNEYIKVLAPPVPSFTQTTNGLTATFTNTTTGATSYSWNFGDGNTSTQTNPTHTYAAAGTYTVTLTANNAYCNRTSTATVTVQSGVVASFNATPTSGCASLTVQYTSTSAGAPTTFTWNFPGGTPATSTEQNPTVVYTTPGVYAVTLTVGNGSNTSSATQQNFITVYGLPNAGFNSSVSNLTATFTNSSTAGGAPALTYAWTFGDGDGSTATNPTHTYAADGTYTVRLIATNACGSDTTTQQVVIVTPPTANFTASPTSGCAPLSVQYTSTSSTNAATYSWQFPGGAPANSTAQNPTVIYTTPGTYSVTLTVGNAAGTNSATQQSYITVNTVPTVGFTSSTNGTSVSFTNTSSNATSYSWAFGDGNGSTATNPTHTYATDGVYTVTLTATNPCGTVTSTSSVTIVTPPTANFTASPTSGCAPLTVQYTSTSSTNAATYSWQFPGGTPANSTAQNPTVIYTTPGTYSVTLTVGNAAGTNSATQQSYVTVNTVPTPGFTNSVNGPTVSFTNTTVNGTTYSWAFGDGNGSTATSPTHTYTADGTYTVTLTATNPCGSSSTTSSVTVTLAPTANFNANVTSGCAPLTVTFNNTSSSNATTYNWQFPGGTPSSSTAQSPTVVYAAPGTYSVTLTASNAAGSSTATQQSYIVVNTVPSSAFTSSVSGSTASFTNGSSGATSYTWDFGDNTASTAANPNHTYTADGTYTVVLTATNACGTSTYTQDVVIITSPTAGFTAQTTVGCAALSVQFQDLSSSNTTSWTWSFPGGTPATSTAQHPLVVYDTPGAYDVTLVASGPGGSSTFTQTSFITALGTPTAGFTSSTSGATATFTNASGNASTYLWNFGDNSNSAAENPTHTYTADGTYTVTLTATNNCGTSTSVQQVTIVTLPTANYTQNGTSGCAPFAVQFTNQSSTNVVNFLWEFPGGTPATSTEQNPTATYSTPGTYTVTLTVSNAAGTSTSSSTVTVLPLPVPAFTTQGAGLAIVFTNTSANATTYSWDFGDNSAGSTEANPTHTYALPGTYTVTLKATNSCGTVNLEQQVVVQGSAPIAQFVAGETAGCVPLTVSFSDQSAGGPTAWKWTFPGGTPATSNQQNPTVVYTTPGIYDVTLEVTNPFGTNLLTKPNYITVQAFPSTGFTYTASAGTVTFTNSSSNALGYSWNFGDGSQPSTATNPVHTYTASGTYTVELTAVNNCGAATLQQQITVTTSGVNDLNWLQQFRLYPNPNTGQFRVEMSGPAHDEVEFTLFNAVGQFIHRDVEGFGTGTLARSFDYGQLPSGVYALRVQAGSEAMWVKVVVER